MIIFKDKAIVALISATKGTKIFPDIYLSYYYGEFVIPQES
ncbi:hypothetical protein HNP38_001436 [Chryseobacterium defluvii]|uniref:Uncharacterized protein n=1 Tax=Chryseobacterium defluvii TaxID=160396 RepID=A0A840KEK5_9FLAO|nr:hypothetical protein [Chryseobacterium defluvii]MBB4806164.1 hypothetical protein [Chryseobacterium defluvii]